MKYCSVEAVQPAPLLVVFLCSLRQRLLFLLKLQRNNHERSIGRTLPTFLSCLCWGSRHVAQVLSALAATIRWWLTELIVKDFSLRMQDCPVCPALISTDTTSLTGRASWNYRWHWITTDQHLMFYHISCKISLTTAQPVQSLLKQAVFDVPVDLSTVNGSLIPVKCFMLVIRTIAFSCRAPCFKGDTLVRTDGHKLFWAG